MRIKALLSVMVLLLACGSVRTQEWSKYVHEKQRNDIMKKSFKGTGFGGIFAGKMAGVFWITDPMARVIISKAIDRERLSPDEATSNLEALRPNDTYTFIIDAVELHHALFGVYGKKGNIPEAEMFLQRADNRKLFIKGDLTESDVRLGIRTIDDSNLMIARFPKVTRAGEPLVLDLADKIEMQFTLAGKKVILEYKLKDMVSRLEDL
jgi:hypothetical protein